MRMALITGIDHYDRAMLTGSVNDGRIMTKLLRNNSDGSRNYYCKPLLSSDLTITKERLMYELQESFNKPASSLIFYFAGHGTRNLLGGYIVTQNASMYNEGISFRDIMALANQSSIPEIIIILDCCYSGHLANEIGAVNEFARLRKGVAILASCRPNEQAKEKNGAGVFTSIMANALKGEGADLRGNITLMNIFNHVDTILPPWAQRPVFKLNIDYNPIIRKGEPPVSNGYLHRIMELFPTLDHIHPLDASYEPTVLPANPEHEEIFHILKKYRSVGLVSPVSEDDMYYEALKGGGCRLTFSGRWFWRYVRNEGSF